MTDEQKKRFQEIADRYRDDPLTPDEIRLVRDHVELGFPLVLRCTIGNDLTQPIFISTPPHGQAPR